jgi:hypothetical protein
MTVASAIIIRAEGGNKGGGCLSQLDTADRHGVAVGLRGCGRVSLSAFAISVTGSVSISSRTYPILSLSALANVSCTTSEPTVVWSVDPTFGGRDAAVPAIVTTIAPRPTK